MTGKSVSRNGGKLFVYLFIFMPIKNPSSLWSEESLRNKINTRIVQLPFVVDTKLPLMLNMS